MMIEAVIAVALIAVCAGTVMAAVVAIAHQFAVAQPAVALTLSAQNIITDIRAATAYDDAPQLAALAGTSAVFDVSEPVPGAGARRLHVVVKLARAAADNEIVASVSVGNAAGQSATVQSVLVREAPAPGSTVDAGGLAPTSGPALSAGAFPAESPAPRAPEPCGSAADRCNRARGPIVL